MNITANNSANIQIKRIQVVKASDVDSIDYAIGARNKTITLKAGGEWIEIPFTMGTGDFSENGKRDSQGVLIAQDLAFDIAGQNNNNDDVLSKLERIPVIALITWIDDSRKFLGSKDNGGMITWKGINNLSRDNQFSINCNALNRAFNYVD